ncbi:MAG TPA: UpxY family transcription antiterminator [Puia sp.]|jgi:transcription antitermination factor NusG|nr:UpxY family transcription antiterminator [Puia sp.]
MESGKKKWYAIYTKPRWEKKVYDLLHGKGIEAYCPLNKVRKRWSDRIKWVDEPLFKSYVFVKIADDEQANVRMTDGVVNFVYWLGRRAVVKDKEIVKIRKFLNEYRDVAVEPVELDIGSQVTVRNGPFMDKQAKVVKVLNKKVKVLIESIGYYLVATVDRSNLDLAGQENK